MTSLLSVEFIAQLNRRKIIDGIISCKIFSNRFAL